MIHNSSEHQFQQSKAQSRGVSCDMSPEARSQDDVIAEPNTAILAIAKAYEIEIVVPNPLGEKVTPEFAWFQKG